LLRSNQNWEIGPNLKVTHLQITHLTEDVVGDVALGMSNRLGQILFGRHTPLFAGRRETFAWRLPNQLHAWGVFPLASLQPYLDTICPERPDYSDP
jgi:hypothetical protein